MPSHAREPSERHSRVWLIAMAVVTLAVVATAVAVYRFRHSDGGISRQHAARDRCEADVMKQLASPSTAQLSDVKSEASVLDPDSRDLFTLELNERLKGVETARISVWEVSGFVDARSEIGTTMHDPFTCRAYFVDADLADTLVIFEHDH